MILSQGRAKFLKKDLSFCRFFPRIYGFGMGAWLLLRLLCLSTFRWFSRITALIVALIVLRNVYLTAIRRHNRRLVDLLVRPVASAALSAQMTRRRAVHIVASTSIKTALLFKSSENALCLLLFFFFLLLLKNLLSMNVKILKKFDHSKEEKISLHRLL